MKGAWVGATMTVPGVSGGTMAVVVGIYESLIRAINGLRKEPGKYILFLVQFTSGAGLGFILFARFIAILLQSQSAGEITRFFFAGVVAGGIPLLIQKSEVSKLKIRHAVCLFSGAAAVFLLSSMPTGGLDAGNPAVYMLLQAAGGLLTAIALILPGISVTHMLYILGLYEAVLGHIYAMEFAKLIPLVIGVLAGIFLTAGVLEWLMKSYTAEVYLVIIGFVAGSICSLIPFGSIQSPFGGIAVFMAGFTGMFLISRRSINASK